MLKRPSRISVCEHWDCNPQRWLINTFQIMFSSQNTAALQETPGHVSQGVPGRAPTGEVAQADTLKAVRHQVHL